MTPDQAGIIKKICVAATAQGKAADESDAAVELETATLGLLLPLPFERTLQRVREYVATHTWCSSLNELMDACDVPERVRGDLFRAAQEGAEFWPSLRGKGWEVVAVDEPLPRGVGEWHTNLGLPLPRRVDLAIEGPTIRTDRPALAAPPSDVKSALAQMATQFRTGARATIAVQERRAPEIPVELQPAYEKLEKAIRSADIAKQSHAANADEYRRRIEELVEAAASDGALPIEAVKPAAVRLLKRLVKHGGDVAAAEVLGDVWGLQVTAFETAPRDRFEDEPPCRVRVVLGQ